MTITHNGMLVAALAALGLACGSSSSGGGGSGVDTGKSVTAVTDAEAKQVCNWALKQLDANPSTKQICVSGALRQPAATDPAACEALVKTCEDAIAAHPEITQPHDDGTDPCADTSVPASCSEVTVGDVELCVNARAAAQKELLNASCSQAGSSDEAAAAGNPPECDTLSTQCPEYFQ
jgi:hypothetical protein